MKVGVLLFGLRADQLVPLARRAEQLGLESVWVAEHLVLPTRFRSKYPYSADGVPPLALDTALFDPLIALAGIATATSTIRLGTNVFLLPLHEPLTAARQLMTLDLLSGGRVTLGAGVGWLAEEFEAVGVDFATRGTRMSESIAVLRELWTAPEPEHRGRFFSFGPLRFEPKPVQRPCPPIIVAGDSPVALRRAARLGDGWCGLGHTPESAAPQIAALRPLLAEYGRDPATFEMNVSFGHNALKREDVERYAAVGVDRIIVLPWYMPEEAEERLEQLAEHAVGT